ncbi:tRNA sulfurtransferase [Halolamina salifodinae]|uniref:Probable tRNA sulfurtransferase n=1 Tax=Halolamina salifodinae TaxID=1202767 RepID=A0A8T4GW64_9EURY|nr:tRNA sulfurtransferase [Halolamina salifodinae]MBP1986690.1 thiamine biosynthesis protein ThiI [Halolamina salifodinae]
MQPSPDLAVVRFGELGIKSGKVRGQMLDRLAENVRAILEDREIAGRVERRWSRILIWPAEGGDAEADNSAFSPDEAAQAAADTFGVVSTRPAISVAPEREPLERAAVALAEDHPEGATFAVRANRAGSAETHPFTSQEIEREVGAAVGEATGADVDLDDPDRTYRLDVREDEAFVSAVEYDGPGGLPVGTQGKTVLLFSGGLDSPVAGWELFKRGLEVVPVYLDLGAYGGADHLARATETARVVARSAPHVDARLRVVPAGDLVEDLVAETDSTRMLSLRRAMLRVAEGVADDVGAHSLATGESVGQKSSQTGPNLRTTDAAATRPVYRPLLTRDKPEIVEQARDIGTFVDATMNVGCERVAPDYPETNATIEQVEAAEPDDLLARAEALADERYVADEG